MLKLVLMIGLFLHPGATASLIVNEVHENVALLHNASALKHNAGDKGKGICWNSITTCEGELVLYCGSCTYVPGRPRILKGTGVCKGQ